ncbi:Dolichyl-diphosphooligosaccharide--protein glycosyltransferase subunit 1B [Striga hermonthica]|uniref:Dolichyl-diphosphooligosaccharide--protein glycosyltransferase subunit 1 n=1 Tax=Striga hermonthica TaxID=68872 RepID=A0A9N7MC47_STRHE|nr:Dolichyl-diphosphooligosaccharide--protein glycosyltransferase subunit 1B [Striga hermonthica]
MNTPLPDDLAYSRILTSSLESVDRRKQRKTSKEDKFITVKREDSSESLESFTIPTMAAAIFSLLIFCISLLISPSSSSPISGLQILQAERQIDLTSHIVRVYMTLKVENIGDDPASKVLLAFPPSQFDHLSLVKAATNVGKKRKKSFVPLEVNPAEQSQPDSPNGTKYYAISLLNSLPKGETTTLEILYVLTHSLDPFPVEISQSESQLVYYRDSAIILSPYNIKQQATVVKTPTSKVESFTQVGPTHQSGSELRYGPYESREPYSYSPIIVHFENNHPFAVVEELEREIEISHWGSVQSELLIEPRYPLFGGWKSTFVIGYGVPLQDFLFESDDGARYLNYTFGCPLADTVVDKLTIKVVLPEGSKDPSIKVPFEVEQSLEVCFFYLYLGFNPS